MNPIIKKPYVIVMQMLAKSMVRNENMIRSLELKLNAIETIWDPMNMAKIPFKLTIVYKLPLTKRMMETNFVFKGLFICVIFFSLIWCSVYAFSEICMFVTRDLLLFKIFNPKLRDKTMKLIAITIKMYIK